MSAAVRGGREEAGTRMAARRATIAGIPGYARIAGAGPPVVLVHGLAVSSRYFGPLIRELGRMRTVVAPDLPGFGRSATPRLPLDIPELADALDEWLELATVVPAPLVANSLGCQVAVDLAVRRPQRVSRLVLLGPTMDPGAPTVLRQAIRLAVDTFREPPGLWPAETIDYLRMGPRRTIATARRGLADPLADKLRRLPHPALVVRGGRDAIVSQEWAERVARLLPDGRLTVIPGEPHAVHFSAAADVARVVEEFL
jgi:2-hydroxy-6-oxonona-2,4-dienedioate hydrolase